MKYKFQDQTFNKMILVFATNSDFLIPVFQTMNSVRFNHLILKYPRFTSSGWKDKGIIEN